MGVCKVLLKQITVMMIALAIRMVKYRRRKMTKSSTWSSSRLENPTRMNCGAGSVIWASHSGHIWSPCSLVRTELMARLSQVQQGKPENNPQASSIVRFPIDAVGCYKHQLEDGCWYFSKTF